MTFIVSAIIANIHILHHASTKSGIHKKALKNGGTLTPFSTVISSFLRGAGSPWHFYISIHHPFSRLSCGGTPSQVKGRAKACVSISCGLHPDGEFDHDHAMRWWDPTEMSLLGSSERCYSMALGADSRSILFPFWLALPNSYPDSALSNTAPVNYTPCTA